MANSLNNHAKLGFYEIIFAKGFIFLSSFAVIGSDILQILLLRSLLDSIYNVLHYLTTKITKLFNKFHFKAP